MWTQVPCNATIETVDRKLRNITVGQLPGRDKFMQALECKYISKTFTCPVDNGSEDSNCGDPLQSVIVLITIMTKIAGHGIYGVCSTFVQMKPVLVQMSFDVQNKSYSTYFTILPYFNSHDYHFDVDMTYFHKCWLDILWKTVQLALLDKWCLSPFKKWNYWLSDINVVSCIQHGVQM